MKEITVDETCGAMYIGLREAEVARTVEMPTEGMGLILNVDVDKNGVVVGVEII